MGNTSIKDENIFENRNLAVSTGSGNCLSCVIEIFHRICYRKILFFIFRKPELLKWANFQAKVQQKYMNTQPQIQ